MGRLISIYAARVLKVSDDLFDGHVTLCGAILNTCVVDYRRQSNGWKAEDRPGNNRETIFRSDQNLGK